MWVSSVTSVSLCEWVSEWLWLISAFHDTLFGQRNVDHVRSIKQGRKTTSQSVLVNGSSKSNKECLKVELLLSINHHHSFLDEEEEKQGKRLMKESVAANSGQLLLFWLVWLLLLLVDNGKFDPTNAHSQWFTLLNGWQEWYRTSLFNFMRKENK